MAQYIMRHLVVLSSVNAVKVDSCGIYAKSGMPMTQEARVALKELGIKPRFKTKEISRQLVDNADLIICLTAEIKVEVATKFNCLEKTRTFSEFGGQNVSDPYGLGGAQYRKTAGIIFDDCVKVIQVLLKNKLVKIKSTNNR